jgi:hypothetical protein
MPRTWMQHGVLTDVLAASPSEPEAICRYSGHFENWPCRQVNGFHNLIFSDLLRTLGAEAESLAGATLLSNWIRKADRGLSICPMSFQNVVHT